MLIQRLITAVVGIPIIIALILTGDAPYTIVVAAILALAALEFFSATDPENALPGHPRLRNTARALYQPRAPAALGAVAVVALVVAVDNGFDEWTGALAASIALVFAFLILLGEPESGLRDWLWVIGGLAYVGFLGSHLIPLRDLDDNGDWVLLAVFGTFAADTFAYFVGRSFGRVHITPTISPGKTLEGSLAGWIAGFASVLALNWITGLDIDALEVIVLALLLPPVAMVGDLAESLIKRGAGLKDTSELVPGHGGFLDRMDSILFTVPLVYYFAVWFVV